MTYPLSIGSVTLLVHDLARVADFYESVIGLERLARDGESAALGAGGQAFLHLRQDKAARKSARAEAGLFHTAFLLPARADLARWVNHAASRNVALQGASDHIVSEAMYLADPEDNGIEIYVDRPSAGWNWQNGTVEMATERLDLASLLRDTDGKAWQGAPAGTTIGHVHLQVGEISAAEAFYAGRLGLDITAHYPGATFYSSGGYHHHIATNVWNSRGAPVRDMPATGLSEVALLAAGTASQLAGQTITDPWGTKIAIHSA